MDIYQYNEELLFEDVYFPLKFVRGAIIDKMNNVLFDNVDEDHAQLLIGKYKEIEEVGDRYFGSLDGEIIDTKMDEVVCRVEIWQRLMNEDEPTRRMHNIVNYFTNRLNAK